MAFQSTTFRLGCPTSASDLPVPTGPLVIGSEPGPNPDWFGYPRTGWINIIEFGPFPLGFKVQVPGWLPSCVKPITLIRGWLVLGSPGWGPDWAGAMARARSTPDPRWERLFTRDHGWTGADGTATIPLPGGRTLWLFGDSFIGSVIDGKHAAGTAMVNNTIAVHAIGREHTVPSDDALEFAWGAPDAGAKPTAWAVPEHAGAGQKAEWFWPAGGGIVAPDASGHDRLLLFMCRLGRRDASDSIWNFEARGTTMVIVDNPADASSAWRQRQVAIAPLLDSIGRQVTWGAAVLEAGGGTDDLYVLGIDSTSVLDKKLLLARVPAATIERFETWRFWDGGSLAEGSEHAAPVVSPLASELSLHKLTIAGRERYVMIYSELTLGPRILCRTAHRPEGPWSEPITLYDCPEPVADRKLMVYAAKAHPELSQPGELLISYCVNSTDFWDVLAHADKYRPRFIRVPLALLLQQPSSASPATPRRLSHFPG